MRSARTVLTLLKTHTKLEGCQEHKLHMKVPCFSSTPACFDDIGFKISTYLVGLQSRWHQPRTRHYQRLGSFKIETRRTHLRFEAKNRLYYLGHPTRERVQTRLQCLKFQDQAKAVMNWFRDQPPVLQQVFTAVNHLR